MEKNKSKSSHFILVHGLGHGGWCWYKLTTLLRAAGHKVTAIDLAASGIDTKHITEIKSYDDYSEPLMEVMTSIPQDEKVVLVAHSYGGANIALAMEKFPSKISAAVFVTAVMLSPSNSVTSAAAEFFHVHPLEAYLDSEVVANQDSSNLIVSYGFNYLSKKLYQNCSAEDLTLATMLVRTASVFLDDSIKNLSITEDNYGSVRRVYVVCKQDNAMTEDYQRWLIQRSPGAEVKEIQGADHMVMLSQSQELSNLLLDVADKYQ